MAVLQLKRRCQRIFEGAERQAEEDSSHAAPGNAETDVVLKGKKVTFCLALHISAVELFLQKFILHIISTSLRKCTAFLMHMNSSSLPSPANVCGTIFGFKTYRSATLPYKKKINLLLRAPQLDKEHPSGATRDSLPDYRGFVSPSSTLIRHGAAPRDSEVPVTALSSSY